MSADQHKQINILRGAIEFNITFLLRKIENLEKSQELQG
jgi:hypothetical protein